MRDIVAMTGDRTDEKVVTFEEVLFGPAIPSPVAGAQRPRPPASALATTVAEGDPGDETIAQMAANLAMAMTSLLVDSIRLIEKHNAEAISVLAEALRQQQEKTQAHTEALVSLGQKYEDLAKADGGVEPKLEHHESDISDVEEDMASLSALVSERLKAISSRLDEQQSGLSGLDSNVAAISPRVDALAEGLHRQAEVIRTVCEANDQWKAAMRQFVEILSQPISLSTPKHGVRDGNAVHSVAQFL